MNKSFITKRRIMALVLSLCIAFGAFAACSNDEPEPTEAPTPEPSHSAAPLAPIYNIEYDPEQFIVEGSTLVDYIGKGGAVEVPNDITVIGSGAFAGETEVTSITFPRSVTAIESLAFDGCTGLTGAFTPPHNLNHIGDYAFHNCTGITEIAFENKLYTFGEHIFEGCTGLVKAVLPEKLIDPNATTTLPAFTYAGCTSLTDVPIFKEAVSIGDRAFEGCTSLASVTLPDKVKEMGKGVFAGCGNLAEIGFSKVLYSIGGGTFEDTAWYGAKIAEIKNAIAAAPTDEEKMKAGFLTIGQNAVIAFVPASDTGDVAVNVSENTYSLNEGTFDSFIDRLVSVTYPENPRLEFLGDNLFSGAVKLKSIVLPSKLKTISDGLFDGCVSLENVEIKSQLVSIGNDSFRNCSALTDIYLPDSIKSIGDSAFFNCHRVR